MNAAQLSREDLYSLEKYAEVRPDFRAKIMAHKKVRVVPVGPNVTLHFEDRMTMQYQIQEMLRAEKIFEAAGIQEELDAYNPLIPDGQNWKATMMIEFDDPAERRRRLAVLHGIEVKTWVQVAGFDKVFPIANEDLDRETEEKTSSVHFLRFELTPEMCAAAKQGAAIGIGISHPEYNHAIEALPDVVRDSLVSDLD
ncbi:MAG: DUF3501 family protein [Gammaproteobacteria bacterium]|jgi:hypothetical protein